MTSAAHYPRPMRRLVLGALLILLLTACDGTPPQPDRPPAPKLPAGIVAAIGVDAPDRITVADPQTGRPIRTITLPAGAILFDRRNFSADWSRITWLGDDGSLNAGELRGDSYLRTATWKPATDDRYTSPAFHPGTGRIWA